MDKAKLKKIFKDYPFLWAIKKDWHVDDEEIKVESPDEELFQATHFFDKPTPPCYLKSIIWIYVIGSNSLKVTRVVAKEGTKLGEAILSEIIPEIGDEIEIIVIVRDMGGTLIIKPPKNISFNDFIANALKNKK
ncbi:MAG: hypothetical protein A2Y82_02640 [Candidatus Buchananbacteria bacterium RBG_13_36_9]|uniref:Uncharacterized protein n=1 Tax=Candidatus Buchananbacteria bacterium RBG_13_36_9 TaxID=1797530 RepID=A0A1G1XQ79_9BACT|nr:MAG: hypothetical protein A2Y82_02640 [Candidatus Buchananbacteria bacterium RBG_13_36_9]